MIPIIEGIAALTSVFVAYRIPISTPILLLFLNIHFGHTYIGSFNLTILFFLLPAITIISINHLKLFKKIESSNKRIKFFYQIFAFFSILSITHLIRWKSLPIYTLKLLLKSTWVIPICFLPISKKEISKLVKVGASLCILSTLLYLPHAIEFYLKSDGKSIGRFISGGLALNNIHRDLTSIIPTRVLDGRIKNAIYAMIENYSLSYSILTSYFALFFFRNFLTMPAILTLGYLVVFIFVFSQQYLLVSASFLIFIGISLISIIKAMSSPESKKIKVQVTVFTIIYIFSSALVLFSPKYRGRMNNNISSVIQDKVSKKNQLSRLGRLKNSIENVSQNSPVFGFGDHLKKINYSYHSHSIDFLVSFGFPLFIIFMYIFFFKNFRPNKIQKNFIFITTLTSSIFLVSTFGLFGTQPGALGYMIFICFITNNYKEIDLY